MFFLQSKRSNKIPLQGFLTVINESIMSKIAKNIQDDDDFVNDYSPKKAHKTIIRNNRRRKENERNNTLRANTA
jgi:hypothetical protein